MKTYIEKPKSVKMSEIIENNFIFAPIRYKKVEIINTNIYLLKDIISISKETINIERNKGYYTYIEIGDINNSTGGIEYKKQASINISSPSINKLLRYDILISTVRTYLGGIGINLNDNSFSTKALIVLRKMLINKDKFYIYGFLRSKFFIEQASLLLNSGVYPRLDKSNFDLLKIPFPSKNNHKEPEKIEKLVSSMVQNLINKEEQIKRKNEIIDKKIEKELRENQVKGKVFNPRKYTNIIDIKEKGRLDSDIFSEKVREIEFITENYINGCSNISDNFKYCRGQNLQVSQIGESYYSDVPKKGFYKIFTNVEMQDNRTIIGFKYLGNKNKLALLPDNGIMFSADGTVGRSFFFDKMENTITNIHPWVITAIKDELPIYKRVFLSLYLSFLKNICYLEKIKDKANGGGLKKGHLDKWIKIPNFNDIKQEEIAKEYYNKVDKNLDLDFENYLEKEFERNKNLGIFQLNMEIFSLREVLENIIDKIIMDEKIDISFDY